MYFNNYLTWGGRNHPPPKIAFLNGLEYVYMKVPLDFFENSEILQKIVKKSEFRYLVKVVLEHYGATTTKPRQIERSCFFYWTTTDKLQFTD